jgi:hypothetical protein
LDNKKLITPFKTLDAYISPGCTLAVKNITGLLNFKHLSELKYFASTLFSLISGNNI